MAAIRTRVAVAYAAALSLALGAYAVALWQVRREAAYRDLQDQVRAVAELGDRILIQAGTEQQPVTVVSDSLVGRQLSPRLRAVLEALPGYLVVADSMRALYLSAPARGLVNEQREALLRAAFRLTPARPAAIVTIEGPPPVSPLLSSSTTPPPSLQLLLVAKFEVPTEDVPVRRVVAGLSTEPLAFVGRELVGTVAVLLPVVVLSAAFLVWLLAGRALRPIDRMIDEIGAITDGRSLHRRLPETSASDELDRLAVTMNAMMARLESSFSALRRFTADASHELKTPLAVIRADLERAMSAPGTTEQMAALEEALQQTTRMADLVDSLLTLARADEGRFDLHREPVPLEPVVRDVLETALILGEAQGIAVAAPAVEAVTVQGDATRLRHLFLNLVTNAIKYTAPGGRVEISLLAREGEAQFVVQDTGMGIAAADVPYIFDRFFRADKARTRGEGRAGGVGLGLAISQYIAHAHGGSISVVSRLGRGSTFTVSLPTGALPRGDASA